MSFRKGDMVIGNHNARMYTFTYTYTTWYVTKVRTTGRYGNVEIRLSDKLDDSGYGVDEDHFFLYEPFPEDEEDDKPI